MFVVLLGMIYLYKSLELQSGFRVHTTLYKILHETHVSDIYKFAPI
jgi:hypothetical protein